MKKIKKKGDLPSGFIVIIVLLLIGFAILLIFLFKFLWQERIDKETCHQSVLLRGTASSVSKLAEDYVPLKCKTTKYCITTKLIGKGNCKEFSGEEKEVTTVRVKDEEDIEQFFAREIIDCWSMMGEGRLSLFSQYIKETYALGQDIYPTCVICSRIAFDEDLKNNIDLLSQINIEEYMKYHKVPDKDLTYFDYLARDRGKISIKTDSIGGSKLFGGSSSSGEVGLTENEVQPSTIYSEQMSILFMQISAPTSSGVIKNDLKAAFGTEVVGGFIVGAKFIIVGAKLIAKPEFLAAVLVFGIYQQYEVAKNRAISAAYCGDISVGSDARSGCSVVRTINYNVGDITKYCQAIESIP